MTISGQSRKVKLRGGGTLCLQLEGMSWMNFDEDERLLFSAIVDALQAYEQKQRDAEAVTQPEPDTTTALGEAH